MPRTNHSPCSRTNKFVHATLLFIFAFLLAGTIPLIPPFLKGDAGGFSGTALAQTCTPTPLGSYNTPDYAVGVYVSGSTAYVADRDSLQIINVTNPASPTLLGSYATQGLVLGVYVSGSTAYVANDYRGLQIINVTNPASPTLLGSYDTPDEAFDVYVSGSTAYVADGNSGLQIINVTNPASPTLLGSYDTPNEALDVYVSGSTAYVAKGYSGLQIIDVSSCIENCTDGVDNDGDGLVDCADPECCDDAACFDTQICDVITEDLLSKEATLNNVNMEVVGIQNFACTFDSANLELVRIDSGAFKDKGFFKGTCQIACEGVQYAGEWRGVIFRKPPESQDRNFYLKGAIRGGIEATVEGYLSESVPGSENYNKYQATWQVGRLGGVVSSFTLNVNGDLSYQGETPYNNTNLLLVRDNIETTLVGYHDNPIPLSIALTHLRVASEDNPYAGEGFSIMSYNSQSGSGQGWTYDRLLGPGFVEMKGLFSSPLYGIASATLDDSGIPRTMSLSIARIDEGIPPMADLEVKTWGPERVSPGQTVDYLVEYRNDGVVSAEDVVVVLQLPPEVEYISSTGEGIYRWETHEVIWKLGTLIPRSKGTLSAKVWVQWGLPWGTQLGYNAMICTTSDEKDVYLTGESLIDCQEYLDYQPPEPPTVETFAAQDKLPELLQDPQFEELYNDASNQGFVPGDTVVVITRNDGTVMTSLHMVHSTDGQRFLFVNRVIHPDQTSDYFLIEEGENFLTAFNKEGGVKFFPDGSLDVRREYISSRDASDCILQACSGDCLARFMGEEILGGVLGKVLRPLIRLKGVNKFITEFTSCFTSSFSMGFPAKCKFGTPSGNIGGCTIELTQRVSSCILEALKEVLKKDQVIEPKAVQIIPAVLIAYAVYSFVDCWSDCVNKGGPPSKIYKIFDNPFCIPVPGKNEKHVCSKDRRWREFYVCEDDCNWHLREAEDCQRNGECPNRSCYSNNALTYAECFPRECDKEPSNSGSGGSNVTPARDPNIKYGPSGAVVAGQKLDYKVEFENEGEGIAFGVYFTDTLDEDLDESTRVIGEVKDVKTGLKIGEPGTYNPATRTITWFVSGEGQVDPEQGGYAEISVNVKSGAANGTEIINYGTVYFPSVPEETRTNAIVSRIPLIEFCDDGIDNDEDGLTDCEDPDCHGQACVEVCDDGMDNDGDGFVDCADTDCPPCPEDCGNGLDDDEDGYVDCDDPDCTCCDSTNYSKGTSSITFKGGQKDSASLQMCVNRAFCDALRQNPKALILRLDDCNEITIPGNKLRSDRSKTRFSASSSTYTLVIDCKKGVMSLRLKKAALKACVSNPVKMCVSIKDGPCLCAEHSFVEKRDRKGNPIGLSLRVTGVCPP